LIAKQRNSRGLIAKALGISRSTIYYKSKKLAKDWRLKTRIEEVLSCHPGYGYRRVALHLKINKKRTQRVMRLFGMKAYRRRGRKPKKKGLTNVFYPNLLKTNYPQYPNHIWVSDFTYIPFKGKFLYLATVMDLFTREIVGWSVLTNHSVQLILQALFLAFNRYPIPRIFHSDNGREYGSRILIRALTEFNIRISRSTMSAPWENGYQEAFYSQFKVDLGDPGRFKTLGELVYETHRIIWEYNHTRIHSALRMSPILFAKQCQKLVERMS
jgi:putative transposase